MSDTPPEKKRIVVSASSPGAPRIKSVKKRLWLVFYTKPRAEKQCEDRLDRQGVEVFLPKRTVLRQWSDRKKKVIEPLFRNYIFANVDEKGRLQVLQDYGIVTGVRDARGPATISEEEIEALKLTQRDPEKLGTIDFPLPPIGSHVEVTYGVMEGMKGEVIVHRNQEYIIVRVHSIGQAVKINIPVDWVRRLPGP